MRFGPDGFLRITGKKCTLEANLEGIGVLPYLRVAPSFSIVDMMKSHVNRYIASHLGSWLSGLQLSFVALLGMDAATLASLHTFLDFAINQL